MLFDLPVNSLLLTSSSEWTSLELNAKIINVIACRRERKKGHLDVEKGLNEANFSLVLTILSAFN